MNSNKTTLYVGTVGFSYDAWGNGLFYPSNLPRSEWLAYYANHFNAVEISHSFSKVPEKETFLNWYAQTGPEFKFSLRGNQYITHVKKLKGVGEPLKLFMEPSLKLQEKLASIVWEIPKLGRDQSKLIEGFAKHLQKYPKILHFFDFSQEMILEQKTLQFLQENNFEIIGKLPQDSVIQNKHYFRVSSNEKKGANEWEKDLFEKLQDSKTNPSTYLFFDEPQGGLSLKSARAFLDKIKASQ